MGDVLARRAAGRIAGVFVVIAVFAVLAPAVASAQETAKPAATKWGYIPMKDGARLRYTAWLPEGKGPFPTLMNYEGYQAGTAPDDSIPTLAARAVAQGYAVVGVNLRGSGCSDGTWEVFGRQQGEDGATAVDWLAEQPWSTGKVGLFSYSYGGIMQTWVAAARPKHLVAMGPGNVVADVYRDIAWPGGMLNTTFPPAWGAILNVSWKNAAQVAAEQGDPGCAQTVAKHYAASTNNTLLFQAKAHPWDDAWHYSHSVANLAKNIEVPTLGIQSFQDEEVGPRGGRFFDLLNPDKTWLVASPGYHELLTTSIPLITYELEFFDHFVKGIDNGFEKRPHVQIWHETSVAAWTPRSVTTVDRLPVKVDPAAVPLGPKGMQSDKGASESSYDYPLPAPAITDASNNDVYGTTQENTWTAAPDVAAGRAAFTTPPLAHTITTYGPASADLWVSTTAPDVDLQVTITEVRPDGQEMYVQRGWLRASDRALDAARSTAVEPVHPFTQNAAADMPVGKPQLLRVDVLPFGHTFRAGSSIRMYVERPSLTGLWGFDNILTPQTVTVHHDATYPSRLVLGILPNANVLKTLPACGNVHSQACRANPIAQPAGSLDIVPAHTVAPPVAPKLKVRFYGTHKGAGRRAAVKLSTLSGGLSKVTVELRRGGRTVARSKPMSVDTKTRTVTLTRSGNRRFARGTYTLVVKTGRTILLRRSVRVGRTASRA